MQEAHGRPGGPRRSYLTTAIPCVNAAPHLGHALGLVEPTRSPATAACAAAGRELRPFVPGAAERVLRQCAADPSTGRLPEPRSHFARLAAA